MPSIALGFGFAMSPSRPPAACHSMAKTTLKKLTWLSLTDNPSSALPLVTLLSSVVGYPMKRRLLTVNVSGRLHMLRFFGRSSL